MKILPLLFLCALSAHGQALFELLAIEPRIAAGGGGGCPSGLAVSWKGENLNDSQGSHTLDDPFTDVTFSAAKINNGLEFDGSSFIRVDAADSASLSMGAGVAKSWSFWVKFDTLTDFTYLFFLGTYGGGDEQWECYLNATDQIVFQIYDSGGAAQPVISTPTVSAGTFAHVVVTYDGAGSLKIYINGGAPDTASISDGRDTAATFHMGMNSGGNGRFDGILDEIQIYTKELSAAEVASLYNSGSGRSCP